MLRLSGSTTTRIDYDYAVSVTGKAAAVGGRLLDGATEVVVRQFFQQLGRRLAGPAAATEGGLLRRILTWLGLAR